ncbi:hypothetical protein MPC4_80028 [Methylocella tundrae]|uniref:Uncharacterized protein n=1 Tax=Methylocella tundrae TaxID=227605 RepID=A0A8B6MBC9_METTU|nr:hypothetical protein MPC4_80028 [Methylocella tundrae]
MSFAMTSARFIAYLNLNLSFEPWDAAAHLHRGSATLCSRHLGAQASLPHQKVLKDMRAEAEGLVQAIKQSMGLLRRHL